MVQDIYLLFCNHCKLQCLPCFVCRLILNIEGTIKNVYYCDFSNTLENLLNILLCRADFVLFFTYLFFFFNPVVCVYSINTLIFVRQCVLVFVWKTQLLWVQDTLHKAQGFSEALPGFGLELHGIQWSCWWGRFEVVDFGLDYHFRLRELLWRFGVVLPQLSVLSLPLTPFSKIMSCPGKFWALRTEV